MGSKRRIAKDILPIILENRKPDQWYVEPFCGGCNMIELVNGNRIANDYNEYVAEMWNALVNKNWQPPTEKRRSNTMILKQIKSNIQKNL